MPIINPEEAIRNSFKILNRQRRLANPPAAAVPVVTPNGDPVCVPKNNEVVKLELGSNDELRLLTREITKDEKLLEEILLRKVSSLSGSGFSSHQSDSQDISHGMESTSSAGSVYIANESSKRKVRETDTAQLDATGSGSQTGDGSGFGGASITKDGPREAGGSLGGESRKKRRARSSKKGGGEDADRKRTTWLPCTCPQYKVSNQLASRRDVQGIFFAKVMSVKVIQLLVINIVIFATGYCRPKTLPFFMAAHDWAYLAYGLFVTLLVCLRVALSYRARWPLFVAIILLIPLTAIIAFTSSCITVIYNSVLIPLVTCTVFLSFLMLAFTPYLLKKLVMHRTTNFAASALVTLSSIMLLFLKEMESKPITYWEFVSHVWLPALLLSQIVVQVTVFEIQRMLFGLCFNVSSTRWHIAALYV